MSAVTFQSVAAEAGISVRLIQYYFGAKDVLLLAVYRAARDDEAAAFSDALGVAADGGRPPEEPGGVADRAAIRVLLLAALPAGVQRRSDAIVLETFRSAALTGSRIGSADLDDSRQSLVALLTEQLTLAGRPLAHLDAEVLGSLVNGLTGDLTAGTIDLGIARRVIDRALDGVLQPS